MSLTGVVMALLIGSSSNFSSCVDLPKNFGNYRDFAGIAVSEDFRKFAYLDKKGKVISGKLPKWGRVYSPSAVIYHNFYDKNGRVEDHQICIYAKNEPISWCGEPIHEVKLKKGEKISYSARIFRLPDKIIHGNTKIEQKCKLKSWR